MAEAVKLEMFRAASRICMSDAVRFDLSVLNGTERRYERVVNDCDEGEGISVVLSSSSELSAWRRG